MGAGLASGVMVPSYIVYRCKHLYSTWCQSEPASALYGASGSAWMDTVPNSPCGQHVLEFVPCFQYLPNHSYNHFCIQVLKAPATGVLHLHGL